MCFDVEAQHLLIPYPLRRELNAVIEIEIVPICGHPHLRPGNVAVIPVDYGPDRLIRKRPVACKHAILKHRRVRLPSITHEEGRDRSLYGRNAPGCLTVAWRNAVPEAPDVFPTLPTDTVEESKLQVIRLVFVPAIGDLHHVTRLEPFPAVNRGC